MTLFRLRGVMLAAALVAIIGTISALYRSAASRLGTDRLLAG